MLPSYSYLTRRQRTYAERPANAELARYLSSPNGITVVELATIRNIETHSAAANISLFRKHTGLRTVRTLEPGRRGLVYRLAKGGAKSEQPPSFDRSVLAAITRCVVEVIALTRRHT